MIQLSPQESFPIIRGITDHTDLGTYYVRAVIKNAKSGVVIDTINLVDNGDRYFTYNWSVPADVSGQGFFISVITSIYTDAGYTTKSSLYLDEFDTYLIAQRVNTNLLGGGGGADISYEKVRRVIAEELTKLKFDSPITDLNPILDEIEAIKQDYSAINQGVKALLTKEIPEADYSIVLGKLDSLKVKIEGIKIPELDLTEVIDKIDNFYPEMKISLSELKKEIKDSVIKKTGRIRQIMNDSANAKDSAEKGKMIKIKELLADLESAVIPVDAPKKIEIKKNIPWYRKK